MRRFAGDEYERAVFYPEDDAFLVERDLHVDHHEVAALELPSAEQMLEQLNGSSEES